MVHATNTQRRLDEVNSELCELKSKIEAEEWFLGSLKINYGIIEKRRKVLLKKLEEEGKCEHEFEKTRETNSSLVYQCKKCGLSEVRDKPDWFNR